MRTLLINPSNRNIIKSSFPNKIDEGSGLFPPLGLLYIASYIEEQRRHIVKVLDMQTENIGYTELKRIIAEYNPHVVGIYSTTFHLIDIYLTAKIIKEFNPSIHVILGGPHVNIYPEETIANDNIDLIILGEGEFTFSKLIDSLEEGKNLRGVNGIVYREEGRILKTDPPVFISNLDSLPFPDRKDVQYKRHYNILTRNFPSTTMITSRGCPYECSFCYHSHLGRNLRLRSAMNVINEIKECVNLGIKDISFYDDIFIFDEERISDICEGILKNNLNISWGIRTRVDNINSRLLKIIKDAGCERINIGVESGNDRVLSILRKGISINQTKEAFKLVREAGIEILAYFMIGSPTERFDDILETIDLAIKLNPDYAHFSITLPFPGTDLYRSGLKNNIIKHDFWKDFAVNPNIKFNPYYWNEYLCNEELISLLKFAYRSFYFRPSYIFNLFAKINSLNELKKKIKMGRKMLRFIFN